MPIIEYSRDYIFSLKDNIEPNSDIEEYLCDIISIINNDLSNISNRNKNKRYNNKQQWQKHHKYIGHLDFLKNY